VLTKGRILEWSRLIELILRTSAPSPSHSSHRTRLFFVESAARRIREILAIWALASHFSPPRNEPGLLLNSHSNATNAWWPSNPFISFSNRSWRPDKNWRRNCVICKWVNSNDASGTIGETYEGVLKVHHALWRCCESSAVTGLIAGGEKWDANAQIAKNFHESFSQALLRRTILYEWTMWGGSVRLFLEMSSMSLDHSRILPFVITKFLDLQLHLLFPWPSDLYGALKISNIVLGSSGTLRILYKHMVEAPEAPEIANPPETSDLLQIIITLSIYTRLNATLL